MRTLRPEPVTPQWSSNLGFLAATVGSAIGLGNVWRFSYLAGENGGAAFIAVYALAVFFIALPLMIGEFALGRAGGQDPTSAFIRISGRKKATLPGWVAVIACCMTLSYYAVVAGWVAHYLWLSLFGSLTIAPAEGYAAAFEAFASDPLGPVVWQAVIMAATAAVVAADVNAGIERLSLTVMPVLAVIIVGLAAYSMSLPGSSRGIAFLFVPDWSVLDRPQVYLAALGQAFFSLGVGYGTMLTYGAYARREYSLPRTAASAALADMAFAFVAGIAVFGAVFAFGLDPARGPHLAFVTLPQVFSVMPGGAMFAIAFFALLLAAAMTSAVGFLEVAVAALTSRTGLRRTWATWLLAALIFAVGVPAALGTGPLTSVRIAGRDLLDAYDTFAGEVLLPLSTLLFALFIGWIWRGPDRAEAAGLRGRPADVWILLVRFAVPGVILGLFAASILRP